MATERVRVRLSVYFAIATCLGGLTLAGNQHTEMLPVIACFFAILGLTFVDLLKWFSLPAPTAYVALGVIALYSIGRFTDGGFGIADDQQMVVVAELLVLVQAVLMLQRKNRRIFEQLAIFCLLELVVAAIFNDALSYGLLLLPLGVIGAGALTLLQTYQTSEEAFAVNDAASAAASSGSHGVRTWTSGSAESFSRAGLLLPRVTFTVLTPAVLLVALFFFYGLPRTNIAATSASGGRVLVGFNESVRLAQFGKMLQSDAPAVRIDLIDRDTRKPYYSTHGLYLRGAVLESYNRGGGEPGTWSTGEVKNLLATRQVPARPEFGEDELTTDNVLARVTVEPSSSAALFALAPYHRLATPSSVVHQRDRWLLTRRRGFGQSNTGRFSYQFATTGFSGGRQSRYLPRYPRVQDRDRQDGLTADEESQLAEQSQADLADAIAYDQVCLEYDEYIVPSAQLLTEAVLADASLTSKNPLDIGAELERFLASGGGYRYTLDLSGDDVPGIDPIEQFLAIDRQGNCQHFASAMALMLRSQGIPARLVVGYHTDEFNSIGGFYTARQLHAHAWVEALVDAKWISPEQMFHPRDWSDQYWVRFDPTPGGGGVDRVIGGRVAEVLDLAQSMWSDYVVQRNPSNRQRDGLSDGGSDAMTSQYDLVFLWLEHKLSAIRAGQLGGGALAIGRSFSWTAAALGVALTLGVIVLFHLRRPKLRRWRRVGAAQAEAATTRIAFFAETLRLLHRAGIRRAPHQTPLELTNQAAAALEQPGATSLAQPLRLLTDAFYHTRFGGAAGSETAPSGPDGLDVAAALQSVRERVEKLETLA